MKAMEFGGVFIHGGWLVFTLLGLVWVALLIGRRLNEKNKLIAELREQHASFESLVALEAVLLDSLKSSAAEEVYQFEKVDQLKTASPKRAKGGRVLH